MSHIFVKIDNVDGNSTTTGYADQIACDAFQMGIDLPVLQSGTARTQGSSIRSGILLTHKLDKATPKLRAAAVSGSSLGDVTITVTKYENESHIAQEVITLEGTNTVDGCWLNTKPKDDGSGLTDTFLEFFAIEYTKIKWECKVGGANISETYDAAGTSSG